MEIKSFERSYLEDVKKLLKAAFYRENSNAVLNEWEFAETVLQDAVSVPDCRGKGRSDRLQYFDGCRNRRAEGTGAGTARSKKRMPKQGNRYPAGS